MELGFSGKTVYVYGLGISGRACVSALINDGAKVLVWDDTDQHRLAGGGNEAPVQLINPNEADWSQITAVIKSPGIPNNAKLLDIARLNNVPIIGDIDLLYKRSPNAKYIGITGTNGKSTTTALVAHVLKSAGYKVEDGGNLGKAALALAPLDADGFYVLELSSYQLELTKNLRLDAATVLNLSPDHLERHGSMADYMAIKTHIFDLCKPEATKIMGIDHPMLEAAANSLKVTTLSMEGKKADYNVTKNGKLMHHGKQRADLSYFSNLQGAHSWQNIVCAMEVLSPWVSRDEFFKHIKTFIGLPHRMEQVHTNGKLIFVNDSKATNPESALCSLKTYKNIYWIVGGRAKAEGIKPCLDFLDNVRAAFLVGESAEDFAKDLQEILPIIKCGIIERAVQEAVASARQEGVENACILLAPACSSFDQFKSFEQRGDAFASICRQLTL